MEHPDTLRARANLAGWTGKAGDPAAARDLFAALLPVEERVLGAEHPHTLDTRANLRPLDHRGRRWPWGWISFPLFTVPGSCESCLDMGRPGRGVLFHRGAQ